MPQRKQTRPLDDFELEQQVDTVLDFRSLSEEERSHADFIVEANVARYSKRELYFDFIRTLTNWYFYLAQQIQKENFELCAKLREVIDFEVEEFLSSLSYHYEYNQAEEEQEVAEISAFIRDYFHI